MLIFPLWHVSLLQIQIQIGKNYLNFLMCIWSVPCYSPDFIYSKNQSRCDTCCILLFHAVFYYFIGWMEVWKVCPSVQAITFEPLHLETSFLVCRYILTTSRPSLSIKVIGRRSTSYEKNDNFTYLNMLILCIWLQSLIRSRSHIKVKFTSGSK